MVEVSKLFRVKGRQVVMPDVGAARALEDGTVVWMHGSRPSSLGGYIGTFSLAYQHARGWSPAAGAFTMKTDLVEAYI